MSQDPPDEPINPPRRLILRSILGSLPELSEEELCYLKSAIVEAQSDRESERVLVGL